MDDSFKKNGFLVIKNFISEERAKNLSKEILEFYNKNPEKFRTDFKNTPGIVNYISSLEILIEKTNEISEITGDFLLPVNSYNRNYQNGDILDRHTDRDGCEISLTLHLDGDIPWKFYFEDLEGNNKSIILNSGDALLYSGCEIFHYRKKFEGNFYNQLFLHYVKSRGSRIQFSPFKIE